MKTIHSPNRSFYLTGEAKSLNTDDLDDVIWLLTKRKSFQLLIKEFQERSGNNKLALLMGHGGSHYRKYCYIDRGKIMPIQDWINKHDGKYGILIVCACNSKNHPLVSRKSILIHPNKKVSRLSMLKSNRGYSRIFVPGFGYIENNYYLFKKALASFS